MQQKITKKVSSQEDVYLIYIGILQAVTGLKITDQEKRVLSTILTKGELTKDVRSYLITEKVASKQRLDNIVSKLRTRKILIGDKPNPRFQNFKAEDVVFSINLIHEETAGAQQGNS